MAELAGEETDRIAVHHRVLRLKICDEPCLARVSEPVRCSGRAQELQPQAAASHVAPSPVGGGVEKRHGLHAAGVIPGEFEPLNVHCQVLGLIAAHARTGLAGDPHVPAPRLPRLAHRTGDLGEAVPSLIAVEHLFKLDHGNGPARDSTFCSEQEPPGWLTSAQGPTDSSAGTQIRLPPPWTHCPILLTLGHNSPSPSQVRGDYLR